MTQDIRVRQVRPADLDAVTSLEERAWSPLGTPILTRTDLATWLESGSPFFFLALSQGEPCGYYYGQRMHFSFATHDAFFDSMHDGPLWKPPPHDPDGNSLFGVNIVSLRQGSGAALYRVVRDECERLGLAYSVGVSRMSGFDRYLKEHPAALIYEPDEVVLWYALASAELLGMRHWKRCPERPRLALAPLLKPDPVLACHAKGGWFGITGIQPHYIEPDPESRGYGVRIVSAYPHRRT